MLTNDFVANLLDMDTAWTPTMTPTLLPRLHTESACRAGGALSLRPGGYRSQASAAGQR